MQKMISSAILLSSVLSFAQAPVAPAAPAPASTGALLCPVSIMRADPASMKDSDTKNVRIALPTQAGPMTDATFVADNYTMDIELNPSVLAGKLYGAMETLELTGNTDRMKRVFNQFLFLRDDESSNFNSHLGFDMIENGTDPISTEPLLTREAYTAINQVIPGVNAQITANTPAGQRPNLIPLLTSLKTDYMFYSTYQPALTAVVDQKLLAPTAVIGVSIGYGGCDFAP